MTSTYTTNKKIEKPAHNDYVDDWDVPVNANMDIIDQCLGDVTYVNMTGLSTYSLADADLLATTIVLQNTLSNATVTVVMPTARGGVFTIINATTAAGASSLLRLSWSAGGNTFDINQGETILMIADGSTNTWGQAALSILPGALSYSIDGGGSFTLTDAQARYPALVLSGTVTGSAQVHWPATSIGGVKAIYNGWSGGGIATLRYDGGALSPGILTSGVNEVFTLNTGTAADSGWRKIL